MYKLLSKIIGSTAIAAMLVLGGVASSGAVTIPINPGDNNTLSLGTTYFSGVQQRAPGAFTDEYFFDLPDTGTPGIEGVTYSFDVSDRNPAVSGFGIADLTFEIFDVTNSSTLTSVVITDAIGNDIGAGAVFVSTFPAPIDLIVRVTGIALNGGAPPGGAYTLAIAAVPLPPAILLLLSALVGLGFISRRRAAASA